MFRFHSTTNDVNLERCRKISDFRDSTSVVLAVPVAGSKQRIQVVSGREGNYDRTQISRGQISTFPLAASSRGAFSGSDTVAPAFGAYPQLPIIYLGQKELQPPKCNAVGDAAKTGSANASGCAVVGGAVGFLWAGPAGAYFGATLGAKIGMFTSLAQWTATTESNRYRTMCERLNEALLKARVDGVTKETNDIYAEVCQMARLGVETELAKQVLVVFERVFGAEKTSTMRKILADIG